MLETISEIFYSCCTLKKNQKDDEYIFILCPAPSDLEEEYVDEEGNIKKKKLEKVRGTAKNIVDNEIITEWSGREIGSCICCHLIYEDEVNIYRSGQNQTLDEDKQEYIGSKLSLRSDSKSVGSLSSYSSKKRFFEEPETDSNSLIASSDESDHSNEIKDKKRGKRKLNKSKTLSGVDNQKNECEKKENSSKSKKTKESGLDPENTGQSGAGSHQSTNSVKQSDNENMSNLTGNSNEKSETQNKFTNLNKSAKSSCTTKRPSPPLLGKRPPLKNDLKNTSEQKNTKYKIKTKDSENSKKQAPNSQNDAKNVELEKDKLKEKDNVQNINKGKHILKNNTDKNPDRFSSYSSCPSSDNRSSSSSIVSDNEGTKYDEEDMKFNKDISSKIIRSRAMIGIPAEIILKDGSTTTCKVSFSDMESDLSFICDDKVKAVPWSNIKEVFTKKNELKMVNTKVPLFKDPALIVALHLKDTGNCIPLRFNSKQCKEEFLNFATKMIR
ncbi:apicomplexan CP 15/60K like protein [Cryptosporidium canis]|uniref:Apicomplexan CP 15/60K like protein n=1 Tax=Cryptosporidium canis TaxID=195482 RepID=A0ABQ8P6K5_9CRYT|nr:apicomplexan CP 15/60K like protein [Cryptosporidium canis]KAJ1612465.1 apicomplexan CP 15/60K like protein [Cryptosporidium canis]